MNLIRFNKRNLIKAAVVVLILFFIHEVDDYFDSPHSSKLATDTHEPVLSVLKKNGDDTDALAKVATVNSADSINKLIAASEQSNNANHVDPKYALDISLTRMNRLFDILYEKEQIYKEILDDLQVASFKKMVDPKEGADKVMADFTGEKDKYLRIDGGKVRATQQLIDDLHDKSKMHTFEKPRDNVAKAKVEKDKPVIITAANSGYYSPLQATVYDVHQNFPDYKLIVYDLGLDDSQYRLTKKNCKCELIKFDLAGVYRTKSPHISNLKTYAWKPVLIQETLRKHNTVIYIDSSIRFHSNELQPLVNTLKEVGLLTQYIDLKLNCYTNPKQFEWFGETAQSYVDFYTIEANILFFHRNFITMLMMKAWVTCALDESCIAPPGSSIGGCCGCHRYDQDALTVVSSFFYAHPKDTTKLPAYSFTKGESFFFQVRRYEGRNYFE